MKNYILTILVTLLLSMFSTGVMSYIAMATPIGPWIAPTLVLLGLLIFKIFRSNNLSLHLALATAGGSIGGILATAYGFSFPTIFFVDQPLFQSWMSMPVYFVFIVSFLALAAGSYGFLIASMLERSFIVEQKMSFPIGQLIYKMIAAHNQVRKAWELVTGFLGTTVFSLLQGGLLGIKAIIPRIITLINPIKFGFISLPLVQLRFDMLPMLLAIGFIAGHIIAIPLAVGAVSKIFILDPLNALMFPKLSGSDFLLAFCSGMVVVGALQSFLDVPKLIRSLYKGFKNARTSNNSFLNELKNSVSYIEIGVVLVFVISFLTYFKFSFLEQIYVIVFTFVCTYQLTLIAGKIGMAQLGRFATFVMVPALFIFGVDVVKAAIIATFVEISGGVATDVLFGKKMGYLAEIPSKQLKRFQLFGLIISSLTVGIGLGSEDLFAQRSQLRALLINVQNFNTYVLILGGLFGYILKKFKISPMMVLGGLLMPLNYSLGLIAGGILTMFTRKHEEWEPFWSGVFAANSILELIKTFV
jgi:OPT oligopeptide transporter protein